MEDIILYPGVELEDFCAAMEEIRSKERKMAGESRSEIKVQDCTASLYNRENLQPTSEDCELIELDSDSDIEEDFHAVAETIKYEKTKTETQEIETTCVNLPIYSEMHEIQKSERNLLDEKRLPLLCRLCAIPSDNMIDMFGPTILHKSIMEKIHHCLPITVEKTDDLTKKVCLLCLEKLELCYRFHETVIQAERQLFSIYEQITSKLWVKTKIHYQGSLQNNGHCPSDKNAAEERKLVEGSDKDANNINTEEFGNSDRDDMRSSSCENQLEPTMGSINPGIISESQSEQGVCHTASNSSMPEACAEGGFQSDRSVANLVNDSSTKGRGQLGCKIKEHAIPTIKPHYSLRKRKPVKYNIIDDETLSCNEGIIEHAPAGQSVGCNKGDMVLDSKTFSQQHIAVAHNKHQTSSGNVSGSEYRIEKFNDRQTESPFKCTHCKRKLASDVSLKEHEKICTKRKAKFTCDYCKKSLPRRYNLIRHIEIHTRVRFYNCKYCSQQFSSDVSLKEHAKICTKRKAKFTCDYCKRSLPRRYNLVRHIQTHTGVRFHNCKYCSRKLSSDVTLQEHKKICFKHKAKLTCEHCNKEFVWRSELIRHMEMHTGDRLHSCDICPRSFARKYDLTDHYKIHTERRYFQCSICGWTFHNSRIMKRHMKRVHSEEKPYPCFVCHKRYKYLCGRNVHMATHTRRESYKCDLCKAQFTYKHSLQQHRKMQHNLSVDSYPFRNIKINEGKLNGQKAEYSFQCTRCYGEFSSDASFKDHRQACIVNRRRVTCDYCGLSTPTKTSLLDHIRTHTGERPHRCDICGKTFTRKSNLVYHYSIHADRPYGCSQCEQKFRLPSERKTHISQIHSMDT